MVRHAAPSRPARVIVRQGDEAEAAYIIVSGTCEVYRAAGEERVVLRRLGPNDVFGETAVLTGESRSASVVALEEVTLKIVTRDALELETRSDVLVGRVREGPGRALPRRRRAARRAAGQGAPRVKPSGPLLDPRWLLALD